MADALLYMCISVLRVVLEPLRCQGHLVLPNPSHTFYFHSVSALDPPNHVCLSLEFCEQVCFTWCPF